MKILKQSTAVTLHYGQFVDKTDGVTPETAISGMSVYLGKNGATMALRNSATAITHDRGGYYFLPLDTTDTNTLGKLKIQTTDSAVHLGVWDDWMVVPAEVYDYFVAGTDNFTVDLTSGTIDSIHDEVVETTITFRQAVRLLLSFATGKSSGGGTSTVVFRDIADSKNRISATVDANGNRTAVGTRDGS
jgi:hypothetical protein